jgi:flavin-dependent dehydrogenase
MTNTPSTVLIKREIALREDVDVFVAGGGPAGMAAAVTAARQGGRVFLAEAQNCLGGMGTAGMLPIFMAFGDGTHFYAGGFGREMHDRLEKAQRKAAEEAEKREIAQEGIGEQEKKKTQ